ncbi:MAG: hypothetical protein U0610_18025 [bacterium]
MEVTMVHPAFDSRGLEPGALRDCICTALEAFSIDEQALLTTLVFGSRALGMARADSDIDLILVTQARKAPVTEHYRRLRHGDVDLDANHVTLRSLHHLGARAPWAYRLATAIAVRDEATITLREQRCWLDRVKCLITSDQACAGRARFHTAEILGLLDLREACRESRPAVATYALVHLSVVLPIALLNQMRRVPFAEGSPGICALRAAGSEAPEIVQELIRFRNAVSATLGLRANDEVTWPDLSIRAVLHRLHLRTAKLWPEVMGADVTSILWRSGSELDELEAHLQSGGVVVEQAEIDPRGLISTTIGRLIATEDGAEIAARPPSRDVSLDRSTQAVRYESFDASRGRLKLIVGTGGCRVPSCSFCMLPVLAHAKATINEVLEGIRQHAAEEVRRVAIYTDGSFLDDRELTPVERIALVKEVSRWPLHQLEIESLPQFVTARAISVLAAALPPGCRIRVSVGIQSMDPSVRRYVTRSPFSPIELQALLDRRTSMNIGLRVFLLAGKPLMSPEDDLRDVLDSLQALRMHLQVEDVVQINPVLATRGTVVHQLHAQGFFRAVVGEELNDLREVVAGQSWPFRVEFGPVAGSTCTDVPCAVNSAPTLDARALPWCILGDLRARADWLRDLLADDRPSSGSRQL